MAELTYRGAHRGGHRAGDAPRPDRRPHRRGRGRGRRRLQAHRGPVRRVRAERVRDTPISEQAIIGAAMGAAMTGLRPIAELMFSDFFAVTWDMVANQIAKTRYMTDGQVSLPLVIRTANGAGPPLRRPAQPERRELGDGHPGPEGRRAVHAGRRRGPDGGRGPRPRPGHLLRAQGAVRDQGRGPRRRASSTRSGTAKIVRGRHRTSRSSRSRPWCRRPSRRPSASRPSTASTPRSSTCARSSRSTPPRSWPRSKKTSRLFTVEENPRLCGWGAEIASIVADDGFYSLDAPIVRITTPHIPLPSAAALEDLAVPVGRADRRDRQAPPGRRRMTRPGRWLSRPSAIARHGPDGLGHGRAAGAPGHDGRALQPDPGPGDRAGRAHRCDRRRLARPRRPRQADVVDHDARRRRRGPGACTPDPTGSPPGLRPGAVAVDMSTVLPATIGRRRAPRSGRAAPASSTPRCRGASPRPWPAS